VLTYVGRRILAVVPVLFGVTLAVFSMLFLVPGDPVKIMLAEFVTTPDQIAQMRAQLHLDEPVLKQYGRFVGSALRGDLGVSIRSRRPVTAEITENIGSTGQLALASMLVAIGLGVPLGLLAALGRNSWLDVAAMVVALVGVAMPSFWLGFLLIFVFSLHLGWLPATGGGDLLHLVMPAVALGMIAAAIIARLTRSSMLEVLGQDYVRTARAKGLRETATIARHALRNALIPTVTVLGLAYGGLLSGAVMTETIFAWPGIGRFAYQSAITNDFPAIMGVTFVIGFMYTLVNFAVDLFYGWLDPQIRYS
jgi:peptide/nickel transport system permease protein